MPVIPVDASDSRLDPYRELRSKRHDFPNARDFIVEGAWLVERLANSRFPVQSVLTGHSQSARAAELVGPDVPIYQLATAEIRDVVGFHFHRGILAQGQREEGVCLRSGLANHDHADGLRMLICPEIQNEENLGSLLRTCAAFGMNGVLLGSGCPDPLGRRVIRVSMGAALETPVFMSNQLSSDIQWLLEERNVSLVAADVGENAEQLTAQTKINGNWALMVGREDTGLPQEWADHCTRRLTISMPGGTDSLNVAVATAIMLYQLTV